MMNFKARIQVKEQFIKLVGSFININQIQQLDYTQDSDGDLLGITIYFLANPEPMILQDQRDIETIAHYFGLTVCLRQLTEQGREDN